MKKTTQIPLWIQMLKKVRVIYKITNVLNNKIYIGACVNFYHRYVKYKTNTIKIYYTTPIYRSMFKHGFENFRFEILEFVPLEINIHDREQFYMDNTKCYDPQIGYNVRTKSDSNLGFRHSDESKRIIGLIGIGRIPWNKNTRYSKPLTEEAKKSFKLKMSNEKNPMSRAVKQFDFNWNFIEEYPSANEAGRLTLINPSKITRAARRDIRKDRENYIYTSAGGYKWEYSKASNRRESIRNPLELLETPKTT